MPDAYICDYIRTPFGRYGGSLSTVRTDDLGAIPISALMSRQNQIDWEQLDEVILGCANQAGEDNRNIARMSSLLAGLPVTVPGTTVNRLCGSGADSVITAARAIRCGEADMIIAGGVESMSRAPFVMPKAESAFSRGNEVYDTTMGWRFINSLMKERYGVDTMPETAENVAATFNISREDQDNFALRSQLRAKSAGDRGRLAEEIVSVSIPQKRSNPIIFAEDEHPRPGTSYEKLASLPTPFANAGTVTAGNASGVNDGAAAILIASEKAVTRHGLSPLARVSGGSTAGLEPRLMGYGPVPATQKLCRMLDLSISDIDLFEINEAFAAQVLAVTRALGLADNAEHVNPNGGAIALGHPLGASGTRLVGTLALQLRAQGLKRGIASMCVGVGQGISIALEST